MQNFATVGGARLCAIIFTNGATAGSLTTFTNTGGAGAFGGNGETLFFDTASAGNAIFINHAGTSAHGVTEFHGSSTAANGTFINEGGSSPGTTVFFSTAAATGTFINNGVRPRAHSAVSRVSSAGPLQTLLLRTTAASTNGAGGGRTIFFDGSTAGNAIIPNGGAEHDP